MKKVIPEFLKPENKYAGLIGNIRDISKYLLFTFDFSGEHQTFIYSTERNKTINLSEIFFNGESHKTSQHFFQFQHENQLISFLPAHLLLGKVTFTGGEKKQNYGSYSNITDLLPNLREDDNPVLIIGEPDFDSLFNE